MSATRILAQSNPALLCAFPGWKQPTHCRAVFTTSSSGVATMVAADTTPGVSVDEDDSTDGLYTLTFPACRKAGAFNGQVNPATPGTASNHRHIKFDAAAAGSGTCVFRSLAANGGALASPNDTSRVEIDFWLDLG